jgi:hypothetical protein
VHPLLHSSYARGAVSGLGVLNIALGLAELSGVVGRWFDRPRTAGGT